MCVTVSVKRKKAMNYLLMSLPKKFNRMPENKTFICSQMHTEVVHCKN